MKIASSMITLILSIFFMGAANGDRVAIIGGGASGLVTAWLLEQSHQITLYEADKRLGGHADSIEINVNGSPVVIEGGTEFFNEPYYPHFLKLLRHFNIPLRTFTLVTSFYRTDGSDVIILPPFHDGQVEWKSWSSHNLYRSLQMQTVIDWARILIAANDRNTTLKQFVDSLLISNEFKVQFFYPYLASAWGVSPTEMQDFTAYNPLKYIVNSNDVPNYQWYEITGGLKTYIEALHHSLQTTEVRLNARVTEISHTNGHYTINAADGTTREYDHVIFATNANVAGKLLSHLPEENEISTSLNKVQYFNTTIAIHSDERFMPPNKEDWRIVNMRYDGLHSAMSMYKPWKSTTPIFKTWLNYDVRAPEDTGGSLPAHLYALVYFQHAITNRNYFAAQKMAESAQGNNNIWFSGVWTNGNDLHESAIISAINIAKRLAPDSGRLKIVE